MLGSKPYGVRSIAYLTTLRTAGEFGDKQIDTTLCRGIQVNEIRDIDEGGFMAGVRIGKKVQHHDQRRVLGAAIVNTLNRANW